MRIKTEGLTLKQLVEQKFELIKTKCEAQITSDPLAGTQMKMLKPIISIKKAAEASDDPTKLKVSLIGNTALFCDSHLDVLAVGCFEKTVQEQGNSIHHLVDHKHSYEAKIGKTLKVYTEMIDVQDLNVESDVMRTQVLMMDSELQKAWNPKMFQMYKDLGVEQHSVGMQYMKLELAVNDPEEKEEFAVWEKVFPQIINKEFVEKRGYFWYVTEIKLFEISAVLFGANPLTPQVATEKSLEQPSEQDTVEDPKPSEDDTLKNKQLNNTFLTNF